MSELGADLKLKGLNSRHAYSQLVFFCNLKEFYQP
jgi:hypothetical protein